MSTFDPQRRKLRELLSSLETGELQLPEFQRPYKWTTRQRRHLINSIQKNYPIGTLLFLELGPNSPGRKFTSTPIEPVKTSGAKVSQPSELILDGQQRLTSLFLAFRKKTASWTCLDIQSLFAEWKKSGADFELEEHIKFHKRDASPENLIHNKHLLPLYLSMPGAEDRSLTQIIGTYANFLEEAGLAELAEFVGNELDGLLRVFSEYELPVVRLSKDLNLSAITSIFTELNNTGLRLTSFDLCVASFFPDGVNLKKLHDLATQKLGSDYTWMAGDGTVTLQTIALKKIQDGVDGVSSKKNQLVDKLKSEWIAQEWDDSAKALSDLARALRNIGVTEKTLPYDAVVPALALSRSLAMSSKMSEAAMNAKLRVFILATGFNKRYTEGTDSKRESDVRDFLDFATKDTRPGLLEEIFNVQDMMSQSLSGARHKSFLTLLNGENPRDPITGEDLGLGFSAKTEAQLHHIFPESYMSKITPKFAAISKPWNVSLNMAFLSGATNRLLGDQSPSSQIKLLIGVLQKEGGLSKNAAEQRLKQNLSLQLIDLEAWEALLTDDFDRFIYARAKAVEEKLQQAGVRAEYMAGDSSATDEDDE